MMRKNVSPTLSDAKHQIHDFRDNRFCRWSNGWRSITAAVLKIRRSRGGFQLAACWDAPRWLRWQDHEGLIVEPFIQILALNWIQRLHTNDKYAIYLHPILAKSFLGIKSILHINKWRYMTKHVSIYITQRASISEHLSES